VAKVAENLTYFTPATVRVHPAMCKIVPEGKSQSIVMRARTYGRRSSQGTNEGSFLVNA
jgi:hypothetical protein